ncbi:hypothetical protein AB0M35_18675 [Micromonospora sp. NPDC051196]|uniref:hypothetical protein n=1 Tax=Micromonospora sp. NPDC051196 TaxID=3155281 RepID=UPI0034290CBE
MIDIYRFRRQGAPRKPFRQDVDLVTPTSRTFDFTDLTQRWTTRRATLPDEILFGKVPARLRRCLRNGDPKRLPALNTPA